jgi:hypothetical protein
MFNQNVNLVGLTSYAVSVPVAGPYFMSWKIYLPTLTDGGGQSSVVMTIVNGTGPVTVYTGVAGAEGGSVSTPCAAGDVLTFTLSSAAAPDLGLNNVKATISISSGVS